GWVRSPRTDHFWMLGAWTRTRARSLPQCWQRFLTSVVDHKVPDCSRLRCHMWLLQAAVVHQVPYPDLFDQHQMIGDQPAVAAPPHGFRAHQRGAACRRPGIGTVLLRGRLIRGTLLGGRLIRGTLLGGRLIRGTLLGGRLVRGTLLGGRLLRGTRGEREGIGQARG